MKIINAASEVPGITWEEVKKFLDSKLNLQLATTDEQSWPSIQPIGFYYDKNEEKLSITTSKLVKKTQNLKDKPSVYFSRDDENLSYKRVKGGGVANIIEDPSRTVTQGDRISLKYLGTLDHPIVRRSCTK
jgi:nitroimidazol reductase NimA-like FMN-containing flavoprotein (pyridoxamine 5'-phosphate oxidase superfamily)